MAAIKSSRLDTRPLYLAFKSLSITLKALLLTRSSPAGLKKDFARNRLTVIRPYFEILKGFVRIKAVLGFSEVLCKSHAS